MNNPQDASWCDFNFSGFLKCSLFGLCFEIVEEVGNKVFDGFRMVIGLRINYQFLLHFINHKLNKFSIITSLMLSQDSVMPSPCDLGKILTQVPGPWSLLAHVSGIKA